MADIYVSSQGDDTTGDGSYDLPYETLKKGHDESSTGDHIWLADANGVFAEDWGNGAIQWAKQGVFLSSLYNNAPCTVRGLTSSSISFGFANAGDQTGSCFTDLIMTTCATNNSRILGTTGSTSHEIKNLTLSNVRFEVLHDISSSSFYMVQVGGSGQHTGWKFQNCTFDSSPRQLSGLYANRDNWSVRDCNFNIMDTGSGSTYAVRMGASCKKMSVTNCRIIAPYGFLQSTTNTASDCELKIANCQFSTREAAVNISGTPFGDPGTFKFQMDDCKMNSLGIGYAVRGHNVNFTVTNCIGSSKNPVFGFPSDGTDNSGNKFSNCSGTIKNCSGNVNVDDVGHGMLIGEGGLGVVVTECQFSADLSGYACIVKGRNNIISFNNFSGGKQQCVYLKGAVDCEVFGNRIYYTESTNSAGGALSFGNEDSQLVSGCVITDNIFSVTDGKVFDIPNTGSDNTSLVDYNVYNVLGNGEWGIVDGTTVNSLSEVRSAWNLADNDENSRERRLAYKETPSDAEILANQTQMLSDLNTIDQEIGDLQTDLTTLIADTTAISAVTIKVDTMLTQDGAVYQYTANSLENAPSGGSTDLSQVLSNQTVINDGVKKASLFIPHTQNL